MNIYHNICPECRKTFPNGCGQHEEDFTKQCEMRLDGGERCEQTTLNKTDKYCLTCEDMIADAVELKHEIEKARGGKE